MAKAQTKIESLEHPGPKSFYLCCFGSLPHKTQTESTITESDEHNLKQNSRSNSWFLWQRNIQLRVKSQTTKTVPLEGSESNEKEKLKPKPKSKASKVYSSKWRSKSNIHNKTQLNPLPPCQTPPVLPLTPNQTRSKSQISKQNSENNTLEHDTCQNMSSSPTTAAAATATSHAASLPTSKRQVRRLMSSMQHQTTTKQPRQHQNAKRYNPVVGTSVAMVTLLIMILWGRLCAIVCTSAWLYFVPRFVPVDENDVVESPINDSNELDLDSKVYKKKVILEGLLERNHPAVL